jgi:methyl-accepting chemotaxis protein
MSAKAKLLSCIGILFVTAILIVSATGFLNFKSASVTNATENLKTESFLISHSLDQHVQRYFDSLTILGNNLAIDINGATNSDAIVDKLKKVNTYFKTIATVVALKDGTSFISTGQVIEKNKRALDREWYTRIFAGEEKVITKPYTTATGDFVMALAVPVIRDKTVVATLLVNMKVLGITQFVNSLSEHSKVIVSRADGFILASANSKEIGTNLFESQPTYKAYSNEHSSQHNYTSLSEEYVVNSTKIIALGWNVWTSEKMSYVNAASNSNLTQSVVFSSILILISLAIIYILVVKLMYAPIGGEPREIEALVQRVANGDLALKVPVTGKETGIYAATILMINNLKSIISNINEVTGQLKTSSDNVAICADNTNHSSEQQMLQLENTSTSMNEMTMTTEEVARNALQASTAAQEANEFSKAGINVVKKMNDNITTLLVGLEKVMTATTQLEKETQSIGSILEVINAISEQTNLLALNAAIEAARAGDHGRGFAVVSDEVRNLANSTKESTNEIQHMINNLQTEAQYSVQLMANNMENARSTVAKSNEANKALQSIRDAVSIIQNMNDQIATAAEQQTYASSEINASVVSINDLAKTTYESSNSNKLMAADLTNLSLRLDNSVDAFKL